MPNQKDAAYFVQELEKVRLRLQEEEIQHLEKQTDLYVDDFKSLLRSGLADKRHPGVSDGLALLFTRKEEGKKLFMLRVIRHACDQFGRERQGAGDTLSSLASSIAHSAYSQMSDVRWAHQHIINYAKAA